MGLRVGNGITGSASKKITVWNGAAGMMAVFGGNGTELEIKKMEYNNTAGVMESIVDYNVTLNTSTDIFFLYPIKLPQNYLLYDRTLYSIS